MPRKLIWKEEKAFHGWGCDHCGFILSNPRLLDSMDDYVPRARKAFEAHKCEDNPRKPKNAGQAEGSAK